MTPLRLCTAIILTASLAGPARAEESYFMAVFAAQRPHVNQARYTHCYAVFVKVTGLACPHEPHTCESFAISWLAADGVVKMWRLKPECGRNFDLDETMQLMLAWGDRISMWGPYRICKELYDRAERQRDHLESGLVRYKAVDTGYLSSRVSNCMHGVGDMAEGARRLRLGSPGWGEPAGCLLSRSLRPWIEDGGRTYPWVAEELGLDRYPIICRELDGNPGVRPLWWALECFCHRGRNPSATVR